MDNTVVAAIVGLIAGAIGSLIAPWVTWGIEVRRNRRSDRQKMIAYARGHINSPEFDVDQFRQHTLFQQLKPHFSRHIVAAVQAEDVPGHSAPARSREQIREHLLAEVARIERDWGLM